MLLYQMWRRLKLMLSMVKVLMVDQWYHCCCRTNQQRDRLADLELRPEQVYTNYTVHTE